MGLKQMIAKAMQGDDEAVAAIAALPPIEVSGQAIRAYSELIRQWTGWKDATLKFDEPTVSPFASCNRKTHVLIANPERLLLNPNRVLLTVNPFRLRQEAVLTGALLHEASHARHSDWIPRSEIEAEDFKHSDGTEVTKAEMSLAKIMEEPRIEGIVAAEADRIGAKGLAWTMRATAAHVVPMTEMAADPDQALIDLITSWALRAGRQVSLQHHTEYHPPSWVNAFNTLLHEALVEHCVRQGDDQSVAVTTAMDVTNLLHEMCRGTVASKGNMFQADAAAESDTGTFMIDRAKEVLTLLFPETPPSQMPMASGGCGAGEGEGDTGQGVSELPGEADEAGAGEASEGEGEESSDEGTSGAQEGEEKQIDGDSALAKALAAIEAQSKQAGQGPSVGDQPGNDPSTPQPGGRQGGTGSGNGIGGGWRRPTIDERGVKTNAERFLRDMIEPTVASKIKITDQPSSMIDGAALSAWKAGGQVKAPRFFRQVKRTIKSSPPVKIAVLVDVSASMDVMQAPSALLSWALAAACLDLRNYAGGGVQIESTLIHWGDTARVIQRNGEVLPGIRQVGCHDGTTAMDMAYKKIEEQIPDFFTVKAEPENKLIVHFTDWKLSPWSVPAATHWVSKGLESGSTMLSVVPPNWTNRHASLADILARSPIQRGRNLVMQYDPRKPEAVWTTASKALSN